MDHPMDHLKILKRSWEILWRYRALWLFGIILAVTASGMGSSGSNSGYQFSSKDTESFNLGEDWQYGLQKGADAWEEFSGAIIGAGIAVACFLVLLGVAFTFLRYIAQTSLIRMVNDYEETDERRTVKQGFRMGWSKASWRIFLIDLVIGIPVALASIVLLAIALSPLLLWITDNQVAGILGTVAAVGLFFVFILVIIAVSTAINIINQFFYRQAALQNLGVFDSIRAGYALFRKHLKDSILMWLILLGIQIVYGIVALILGIILLLIALPLGGIPGLIAAGIGAMLGGEALPWILGLIVGLPIIMLVVSIPFLFLSGWKEVYLSTSWTLTYREFTVLKSPESQPKPVIANEGIEEIKSDEPENGVEPEVEDIP